MVLMKIQQIINEIKKLQYFHVESLKELKEGLLDCVKFDCTIGDYYFHFNDYTLTVSNGNVVRLLIDTDHNSFAVTKCGVILREPQCVFEYNLNKSNIFLRNNDIVYEIDEVLQSEENHFQISTVIGLPNYENIKEIVDFINVFVLNRTKFISAASLDDFKKIPFDEYFEFCMWQMGEKE